MPHCTGETVFQVKKEDKERVQETIANWIKTPLKIQITWNNEHQYDATTYRFDPKARNLASQLTAIANETLPPKIPLKIPPSQQKPAPKFNTGNNAWVDSTKVKEAPTNAQKNDNSKLLSLE